MIEFSQLTPDKVNNGGTTAQGRVSAEEWNALVQQVIDNVSEMAGLVTPAEVEQAILDNTASEVTPDGVKPVSGTAVDKAIHDSTVDLVKSSELDTLVTTIADKWATIAVTANSGGALVVPNFDTATMTIDFGPDTIIRYGNKYQTIGKQSVRLSGLSTSAVLLIYNVASKSFSEKPYSSLLTDDEYIICSFRTAFKTINSVQYKYIISWHFPFEHTVNNNRVTVTSGLIIKKSDRRYWLGFNIPFEGVKNIWVKMREGYKVGSWWLKEDVVALDNYYDPIKIHDTGWQTLLEIATTNPVIQQGDGRFAGLQFHKADDSVIEGGADEIAENIEYIAIETFPDQGVSLWNTLVNRYNLPRNMASVNANTGLTFISHRGMHLNGVPENSLDAYRYAGLCGYDFAETDFQPTADGHLVLMHDATINRTMRNKIDYSVISEDVEVNSKTLAELREGYVLASDDPRYRREIPTLEEFYITCKHSGIFPIAEIKNIGITAEHVRQAFEIGKRIMGDGNFGFCSFSTALLDYARSLSDNILLLYISTDILGTTNEVTGTERATDKTWWYPSYTSVTEARLQKYIEAGIKVAVWTAPVSKFDELLKKGVDTIGTDTIAPSLANKIGEVVGSEIDFSGFKTSGTMENGILKLVANQSISFTSQNSWLSGYYLSVVGKGKFTITAPNLSASIDTSDSERYIFQGLSDNTPPTFTLKALADTEIEFINFFAAKLL